VYHGGATTLGYLYAAPGAGALLGAVTTGWVTRIRRQGWVIFVAVVGWGAAITLFGLSRVLVLSLVLLALAGWADVISAVLRNTVLMSSIPERFQSRMSSIQMAVVQGGPRLGDLEAGGVATAVTTDFSIISGGVACMVGAVLLLALLPGFRRYRDEPGAPVEHEPLGNGSG
jgi:predicted MFS family arabinose efflux permease